MIVGGIEYLDADAELFKDGTVHEATLASDTDIQGLPCAGGRAVVYFPGGRVRLAWLSRPTTLGTLLCASGLIYLHEHGAPLNVAIASDQVLAGVSIPRGSRVTLDEGGRLLEYSRQLETDQQIDGLPCSAAFRVWLYPDGRPSLVVLSAPAVIEGQVYPRGSELVFDEGGQALEWREVDLDSGRRYMQRVFGRHEAAFT